MIAIPNISNVAIEKTIARSTLKVPPICSNMLTILLSAIGSAMAADKLYRHVRTVNFIIGIAQIPTITIIPTIPTEFFMTLVAP